MTLFNRPGYTKIVLEALRLCHGIEDYLILPHVEPGCDTVIDFVKKINFAEVRPTINPFAFGIGLNTYRAWEQGFVTSDFLIHIEDDTVPAPDCLTFMEAASEFGEADPTFLSISAYNRDPCPERLNYHYACRSAYTCWLVGVWRSRWNWISHDWNPNPRMYGFYLSTRAQAEGLKEMYPLLSRTQNIGPEGGVYVPSAAWHRENQHTDYWAGEMHLPPAPFHPLTEAEKALWVAKVSRTCRENA